MPVVFSKTDKAGSVVLQKLRSDHPAAQGQIFSLKGHFISTHYGSNFASMFSIDFGRRSDFPNMTFQININLTFS